MCTDSNSDLHVITALRPFTYEGGAFISNSAIARFTIDEFRQRHGQLKLRASKTPLRNSLGTLVIAQHQPWRDQFYVLSGKVFEAGIVEKESDKYHSPRSYHFEVTEQDIGNMALNLDHLAAGFIIWSAGAFLAVLVLLAERCR